MAKLYILTLEKIEKRYTKQWYDFFKKEFIKKGFLVEYIDGPEMSDTITSGEFLDIANTNIWKSEQIKKVSELFRDGKINNNDCFLFMDAWHPGVTAIKYMIQLSDLQCRMYGYWHAGSYDPADFVSRKGLGNWCQSIEAGWFNALDGNFVATKFHKHLIVKTFTTQINPDKIHVVGFPMDWNKAINEQNIDNNIEKENIIVFPHRIAPEKNPELFDKMSVYFPDYKFIKTIEQTKTKKEYYELLAKSKVMLSFSDQETFGIGTVESLMFNVFTFVPDRLSYKELYPKELKYSTFDELKDKLYYYLKYPSNLEQVIKDTKEKIIKDSLNAIPLMADIIRGRI